MFVYALIAGALVFLSQGCGKPFKSNRSVTDQGSPGSSMQFSCDASADPGTTNLLRLSKAEYQATLKSLFGSVVDQPGPVQALKMVPDEDSNSVFDTDTLPLTSLHINGYFATAAAIADE